MNTKTQDRSAKVYLIGCGIGDVELLTVKATAIFQKVEVVLYDYLLTQEILDLLPSSVERVCVGKVKGEHSASQEQINAMLLHHAQSGKVTARLKSGDPFVFSRGAEEAAFLRSFGVEVEVVCGLSSALAAPAAAGIAVTLRGVSTGFSVVSACLAKNEPNFEWIELLKLKKHTTVVLMGSTLASQISKEAASIGIEPDFPLAIVSNASRPDQTVHITTIGGLGSLERQIPRPAVLIFGDTVLHRAC